MRYIERHVESLSAVLILSVENNAVRTEYTFSTLSTIFPKTLVDNIAFISPPSSDNRTWDLSKLKVPEVIKKCSVFYLNNPIAYYRTGPIVLKDLEDRALNMLLALVDWLGYRKPQPTKEIVSLYEKYQNIATILDQRAREVENDGLMTMLTIYSAVSLPSQCLHLALESCTHWR